MAYTGLAVTLVTIDDDDVVSGSGSQVIVRSVISSETVASTATGALVGPAAGKKGEPRAHWMLRAAADGYVAFGSTPNSGQSPRFPLTANKEYYFVAREGHKVAFTAA